MPGAGPGACGAHAGLKGPAKQPKRARLWLDDGSCVRPRPECKDHVWASDFVTGRTHGGRPFKMLTLVDELMRERRSSIDASRRLTWLMVAPDVPGYIRL